MKTELLKLKVQATIFSGLASSSYWATATEMTDALKSLGLSACWSWISQVRTVLLFSKAEKPQ